MGITREFAADSLGSSLRTVQRYKANEGVADARKGAPKDVHNKLSFEERVRLVEVANSVEFRDLPPAQVVAILAQQGIYLGSERTLARFLKIENMNAHRRKDKVAKYKRPSPLIATRTGQVWSWDITYLPSRVLGKHFYCYLFMDVYSRKIVGWEVHERECGHLAAQLLHKACDEEGIDLGQLSLHQDNGSPMKAAEFLAAMAQLGITPSYSRPGVSDDNPFSESLFKTMKYRTWYPENPFQNLEACVTWMRKFVNWYNHKHLHSGLKYVTPNQRHTGDDEAIFEKRKATYQNAKNEHPERWARETRNWEKDKFVVLNPRGKAA
jgi:putative transposase